MFTHKARHLFVQKFQVYKHRLEELIAACACLCKFSACFFFCWLFQFFPPYFDREHGKGTDNDGQQLFIFIRSEYL